MVPKKKDKKSGKVKVGKLSVMKETVKDLESEEMQKVKGGLVLVEQDTTICANSIACASSNICKTDLCPSDRTCGGKTCGKKCNP